jgi:NTP pyrophosphatase (non-canonical NTP hydrolase)
MKHQTLKDALKAREQEWDPNEVVTLAFRGVELAGEVGEACNIIKKLERARIGIRGSRATEKELASELADIVICVYLIAGDLGIDMGEEIIAKFNETSTKYGLSDFMEDGHGH